jgi:signal transduction histidine kinase
MNHAYLDDARAHHLQQRLHDGLGQYLSLAAMQIDQAAATAQADVEAETLRRARTLLREALQELRALIEGIDRQAPIGPERDLPARLDACVRRLNVVQTVPVSCTIEGMPLRLSDQACEILLGATRELLVNACKHGQAVGVDARLSILPHRLSITVTERAAPGRTEPTPHEPAPGQGLGLRTARLGLNQIGARLRWRHCGPGGVQARISWVPQ